MNTISYAYVINGIKNVKGLTLFERLISSVAVYLLSEVTYREVA